MNNTEDNVIIWQKWVDPFGRDDAVPEEFDNFINHDDADSDSTVESNDGSTKLNEFLVDKKMHYGVKVIATPMGIIPVNDNTCSGKIFNFWMGHTNFDITKKVADTIENTDGVETLDIYTRYRFRISIGKAFEDSLVMRIINKNVYKELSHGF